MFQKYLKNIKLAFSSLSTVALLAACAGGGGHGGGGGGGGGGAGGESTSNPVPVINAALGPNGNEYFLADAASNAAAQMMTIKGSNFVQGASVLWNGQPLEGATITGDSISVAVPPSDLQASGTASVVVSNPAPGGGASGAIAVSIDPPTPADAALLTPSASELSGGFELSVTASNVLANSVVIWGRGTPSELVLYTTLTSAPTTSGGQGTLTAVVPNALLATQTSLPIAVATPESDGSIKGAVSQSTKFTVTAPVTPACLLAGAAAGAPTFRNYAFVATGRDNNGAASMIGSFRIDNAGALVNTPLPNVVNSFSDFKDPKNLFAVTNNGATGRMSGAAGSCTDSAGVPWVGKIVFTVNSIPGDTFTLSYVLHHNGSGGRLTLTDTLYGVKATGQLQIQYNPSAFGRGSFAFGLLGDNPSADRYAVIGAMCSSSPTFLQADFDDTGSPQTATANGWSLNNGDATTGRTTTTELSFSNGRILNLILYGVGGGKAYAMESSPTASSTQVLSGVFTGRRGPVCLPTGVGGHFTNGSLGLAVFGVSSQAGGAALAVLGRVAPSGGAGSCAAGQEAAVLTEDANAAGAHESIAAVGACYQISAAGRGALAFTDPNSKKLSGGTFYLDGQGGIGYLLGGGASIPYGFVESVAVGAVGTANGQYGFGPIDFPAGLLNATSVALNSAAGTLTDNTAGGSSGTYSCCQGVPESGVATLDTTNTFGDTQLVFYASQTNQIYLMGTTSMTPTIGLMIQ